MSTMYPRHGLSTGGCGFHVDVIVDVEEDRTASHRIIFYSTATRYGVPAQGLAHVKYVGWQAGR